MILLRTSGIDCGVERDSRAASRIPQVGSPRGRSGEGDDCGDPSLNCSSRRPMRPALQFCRIHAPCLCWVGRRVLGHTYRSGRNRWDGRWSVHGRGGIRRRSCGVHDDPFAHGALADRDRVCCPGNSGRFRDHDGAMGSVYAADDLAVRLWRCCRMRYRPHCDRQARRWVRATVIARRCRTAPSSANRIATNDARARTNRAIATFASAAWSPLCASGAASPGRH